MNGDGNGTARRRREQRRRSEARKVRWLVGLGQAAAAHHTAPKSQKAGEQADTDLKQEVAALHKMVEDLRAAVQSMVGRVVEPYLVEAPLSSPGRRATQTEPHDFCNPIFYREMQRATLQSTEGAVQRPAAEVSEDRISPDVVMQEGGGTRSPSVVFSDDSSALDIGGDEDSKAEAEQKRIREAEQLRVLCDQICKNQLAMAKTSEVAAKPKAAVEEQQWQASSSSSSRWQQQPKGRGGWAQSQWRDWGWRSR